MFNWHNFSDSRKLQGDDARVEDLGRHQGLTGESSPVPSKKAPKEAPSPASGKTPGQSSGKGSKKCSKGKSCSATCIYKGDDCLKGLDPKVAEGLNRLAQEIKKFAGRGGGEEEALAAVSRLESSGTIEGQAKKIAASLNAMDEKYPDPAERDARISQVFDLVLPGMAKKGDTGEKQAYSEGQLQRLINNKDIEEFEKVYQSVKKGEIKNLEEFEARMRPLAQRRRVNDISDEQVDLAMALLPKDLIASLGKQGRPGIWGKWGENQDSLASPEMGHTPKNESATGRARLILRIGMEEGMRDMYTGQRVGFGDIDLEHTIPFGVGKSFAEHGSNFGLTTRLNNRAKGDISPEEWRSKVLKQYGISDGAITDKTRERLRKEQAEAQKYNDDRARVSGGTSPETVASVFKGIDESANKPLIKQKLKNKALQSMAGYTETYLHGFRANRAGASRRVYIFRGTELGERVMDAAASQIDKFQATGDKGKVEKALEILRSAGPRINEALDSKYGNQRLDKDATEAVNVANDIRKQILEEINAL